MDRYTKFLRPQLSRFPRKLSTFSDEEKRETDHEAQVRLASTSTARADGLMVNQQTMIRDKHGEIKIIK